ncbi:flagellar basal body P-ring formation chaperone FlgA [Derxia lacustris]|uniref:flagellar basal body P-ring formation chaperone FlgA n=1 Tax=Derxia lacustris TaxID=764842 RepID=UPI00159341C0|nr:flagellar basal body P-ring formation chaperone FlgA [Derxia lacustris]
MPSHRRLARPALLAALCLVTALAAAPAAAAEPVADASWRTAVDAAVRARLPAGAGRIEIEVGKPDARLPAPPCASVEAFVPPGARPETGRLSAGLRCAAGTAGAAAPNWTVYLPVTVKRFAPVVVAARDIAAGTPLAQADLAIEERELARLGTAAVTDAASLAGRSLTRAFAAGQPLLSSALKRDPVMAPGDPVQVLLVGAGFSIRADGVALDLAEAGQTVRIRLDNGQRVQGIARAGHTVELQL